MVFSIINDSRVSVLLSDGELTSLGLSWATLSLANPAFRAAVWLLREKLASSGVAFDPAARLLVEAEKEENGARLYFTSLSGTGGRALVCRDLTKAVLIAENENDLQKAAAFLPGARVFLFQGKRLLLAGATASALASASEYAELVDDPKGEVWARVEEYGEEEGVKSEE